MSSSTLRAYGAQSGVQGHCPCEACQTRELRGPSPSGGKNPAKLHVLLRPCAPMARSPGVQGHCPCVACQTCEPWHPSCHGGKPRKPHVPLCPLPAFGGQSGVKGFQPLREGGKLADVAETEVLLKTIRGGVKNGTPKASLRPTSLISPFVQQRLNGIVALYAANLLHLALWWRADGERSPPASPWPSGSDFAAVPAAGAKVPHRGAYSCRVSMRR